MWKKFSYCIPCAIIVFRSLNGLLTEREKLRADPGGYPSWFLMLAELESFGRPTSKFLSVTSEGRKFERHCLCFPLFQSYCLIFRRPASKEVFINTPWGEPKALLRVSLAVADSNAVCVAFQAAHLRSSWTLARLETQVAFVLKEEHCCMPYSIFLWTLWQFSMHGSGGPETPVSPTFSVNNTLLYFCLDRHWFQ